ncbi:hypothetical protein HAX54_031876 [Datura stramonium]|uniref:Uncharacterized protein n=1 Tax=Datura stramonium TaxID=4076 RepID=A0ABS8VC80_DATST|nr:hypothetical protein [Datura stramonium]
MEALELKLSDAEAMKIKLAQVEEERVVFSNEANSLSSKVADLRREVTDVLFNEDVYPFKHVSKSLSLSPLVLVLDLSSIPLTTDPTSLPSYPSCPSAMDLESSSLPEPFVSSPKSPIAKITPAPTSDHTLTVSALVEVKRSCRAPKPPVWMSDYILEGKGNANFVIRCLRRIPKVIPVNLWVFSAIGLDKLVLNKRENRRLIFIRAIVERVNLTWHLLRRSFSSQNFFLKVYGGRNRNIFGNSNCIFTSKFRTIDCVIAGALVLRRRFLEKREYRFLPLHFNCRRCREEEGEGTEREKEELAPKDFFAFGNWER